jgi:hypothetical protein
MNPSESKGRLRTALTYIGSGLLLLVSTFSLYVTMLMATEAYLVPWDIVPGRPAIGTWQRSVNDFFETEPGAILPTAVVIGTSTILFLMRIVREEHRIHVILTFAASNLLFFVLVPALGILANQLPLLWLPKPRPKPDVGYHRTWPSAVLTVVLLFALLWVQGAGWPWEPRRTAHSRLAMVLLGLLFFALAGTLVGVALIPSG